LPEFDTVLQILLDGRSARQLPDGPADLSRAARMEADDRRLERRQDVRDIVIERCPPGPGTNGFWFDPEFPIAGVEPSSPFRLTIASGAGGT